jgi:FkbM family methyltransferase
MGDFLEILPFYARRAFLVWQHAQEYVYSQPWKAFIQGKVKRQSFRCRLLGGPKISIRPSPSHDFQTVNEIFIERIYDCELDPSSVMHIVDLGGNVGYSCLFWCGKYPNASVVTFEPHPVHCQILKWHVRKNGYGRRVKLVEAAAGVRDDRANLTDEDDGSAIVQEVPAGSIGVRVIDIFQSVPDGQIDLLKIDIEGSEYEILEDPRFEDLAARTSCVLLEWHLRGERGEAFCRDRLSSLGFAVRSGRTSVDHNGQLFCGMLYCSRTH